MLTSALDKKNDDIVKGVNAEYEKGKFDKNELNTKKIKVVKAYMSFYDNLINETIKKNNVEIYRNLNHFLQDSSDKLMTAASNPNNKRIGLLSKSI